VPLFRARFDDAAFDARTDLYEADVEHAAADAEDVAVPEAVAAVVPPGDPLVRSLHVVGKKDAMNPPAQAMKVAEAFFCPELFEHEGGHVVPLDDEAMAAYVDAMR